jgi:hypothetical protein
VRNSAHEADQSWTGLVAETSAAICAPIAILRINIEHVANLV